MQSNRETLWDKSEKFDLNDLNLNLLPDDAESLIKKKRHLKWDAKRKKYVEMTVDRDGKSHRIRNESGAMINDKKKDPEIYKKWMKKTHLRI